MLFVSVLPVVLVWLYIFFMPFLLFYILFCGAVLLYVCVCCVMPSRVYIESRFVLRGRHGIVLPLLLVVVVFVVDVVVGVMGYY